MRLGLHVGYIRGDGEAAFRRLARSAHPDMGGTLEGFQALAAQRDLLLSHLIERRSTLESELAGTLQRFGKALGLTALRRALDAATHGERNSEIDYQHVNPFDDPKAPTRRTMETIPVSLPRR